MIKKKTRASSRPSLHSSRNNSSSRRSQRSRSSLSFVVSVDSVCGVQPTRTSAKLALVAGRKLFSSFLSRSLRLRLAAS